MVLLVDALARRYGVPPHKVLEWDPWELTLNALVMEQAHATAAQKAEQIGRGGGFVFPTIDLLGR